MDHTARLRDDTRSRLNLLIETVAYILLRVIEMLRVLGPRPRSGRLKSDPLGIGVGSPFHAGDRVHGSCDGRTAVHAAAALVGPQKEEELEVAARDVVEHGEGHHHGRHANHKINCE